MKVSHRHQNDFYAFYFKVVFRQCCNVYNSGSSDIFEKIWVMLNLRARYLNLEDLMLNLSYRGSKINSNVFSSSQEIQICYHCGIEVVI